MSRNRKKKNNNNILIIILLVVIAVVAVVRSPKSDSSYSGESNCGTREEDTERSGYCVTTAKDYDELVIVTGNTQNSPEPNLDFTQGDLYDILGGVFYNTDRGDSPSISIVSASGNNYTIEYEASYKVSKNVIASNNELKKLGKELNEAIKTSPSEAGADYLGAILEAGSIISSSAKNPLIIVVGSGYSDSGVLNFATDEIMTSYWQDANNINSILSQNRSVKEGTLNGVSIYWYNIGNVVDPQPNLNDYKEDLKDIYELALQYLGADEIKLDNNTGVTENSKSVLSDYSVQPTYIDELKVGDVFDLNENIGKFYPDKNTLTNPDEVKEKLLAFAKRFNSNGNTKLKLTGYVAYCVDSGDVGLQRAETIKNILIELGVPAEKIETYGERGPRSESSDGTYDCNSSLPEEERRTVYIEVVKE